jgi:putative intracellular protease/amidase
MSAVNRLLLVVTSSDRMGTAPEPTGLWLEEAVAPYYALADAHWDVRIASPLGGNTPLDPTSLQEDHQTAATRRYDADIKLQSALAHTMKLSSVNAADYDAVFFAGGHGTMDDFVTDPSVTATVEAFFHAGKPVASVCHGPACLVKAKAANGSPIIQGRSFTCFSNAEETFIGAHETVPFMLESRLSELGGTAKHAENFAANVVVDGNLITGQNPASSIPAAEAIIHQLRMKLAA